MNGIRLHMPAIPHTLTTDEFSHDAFTGKVKRFAPMMRSRGFEVIHYGHEGSDSGANLDIQIFNKEEWLDLRIASVRWLYKDLTKEQAIEKLRDPTQFVGDLTNWDTPLYVEFNKRFRKKLMENYRKQSTDIVCIPLNHSYDAALKDLPVTIVETGIGYDNSSKDFRIFESYCWLNRTLGVEKKAPPNYWFVIPHSFDLLQFPYNPTPMKKIGFLGRIVSVKGCGIIVELAKRFPNVEFVLCGQGDPTAFLSEPNITYKAPIHGKERGEYLGSFAAVLCLSKFLEPFCCVPVEAQLCGTPAICSDSGGMVETVDQFKTGLRCHTLADMCYGVQMALDGKFDRAYIRAKAAEQYDMYKVAHRYEYVFRSILEVFGPNNGWYSPHTFLECLMPKDV